MYQMYSVKQSEPCHLTKNQTCAIPRRSFCNMKNMAVKVSEYQKNPAPKENPQGWFVYLQYRRIPQIIRRQPKRRIHALTGSTKAQMVTIPKTSMIKPRSLISSHFAPGFFRLFFLHLFRLIASPFSSYA